MTSTRRLWLTFWPAALAAGGLVASIVFTSNHETQPWLAAGLALLAGWSFIAAGLVAWSRRPENATGRLLVALGFMWFLSPLTDANDAWLYTVVTAFNAIFIAVFVHLLLAFPAGRLVGLGERMLVGVTYPVAFLANVTQELVRKHPDADACKGCPPSRIAVVDSHAALTVLQAFWDAVGAALAIAVLVILVRRWRAGSVAARRVLAPVYVAGSLTMLLLSISFTFQPVYRPVADIAGLLGLLAFISVPYFFLAGLARTRLARGDVGRLFSDIPEHPTSAQVHEAFARALHDPSVLVAHWLPDRKSYVDLEGQPFELPRSDSRTWTLVEYEGRRIGAIVHDPSLLEQPELLDAAVATARIGLEKDRLAAELKARLVELERERDFVRTVVDTAPALFLVTDLMGRIIRFNDTLARLSGVVDSEATRGRLFWEVFLAPEEADAAWTALGEPGPRRKSTFRGADGEARIVDWSVQPLHDAQGDPILLITGTDVTERERQEAALRASEARSRALLAAIPDNMFRIRRDGTYVDFHSHDASTLAMSPQSIIGSNVRDHEQVAPEVVDRVSAAIDEALATGKLQTLEYRIGESEREARIVPSGSDEVFMIARDVTDRKRQEEALRASEERGRTLLEAIPDIMFRIGRDGTIVDSHAHEPEVLTTGLQGVPGLNLWDVPQQEAATRILAGVKEALETGQLQTVEYEAGVSPREGRILPSGPDEVVMISRDISDRKAAEEELRRSRARIVEAADAERRRLERNLHDGAQQRLVSLSLALRLAQSQLSRDPAAAEEMLVDAQRELSEALADLRELARGIHPAILTDRGLGPAVEALAARAPLPVEVAVVPQERLPGPVEAAAYYVVAEGLTNVVKYAQASAVRVSIERLNGLARVEIADDGVGGADPAGGTGLRGLADRVESLDGRLAVESRPGSGTRLRAEIPV